MKRPDSSFPRLERTLSSALRSYRNVTGPTEAGQDAPETSESPSRWYGSTQEVPISPSSLPNEYDSTERQQLLQHGPRDSNGAQTSDSYGEQDDVDGEDDDEEAQDSEQADADGLYPPNCTWVGEGEPPARADPFKNSQCTVWLRVHEIRRTILECIDDPYSVEQLKAPRMNISLVRPLVDKFYDMQDLSIVYCLLLNRTQFIHEQSYVTHNQSVNLTRALLCELLAEKVLRRYNESNPGPLGLLKLANILVAGFEPFQGAPEEIVRTNSQTEETSHQKIGWNYRRRTTALQIAIVSESKSFLASSACQKVVDAIYRGTIVYTPTSFIDIIPDHWKKRPVSLYDPRRAPLLNQYRLAVPRTRNIIEVVQFVILLILYMIVMTRRDEWQSAKYGVMEAVFDIYAAGWTLDQIGSILEHGWGVYTQNLWSFLDVIFMGQFILYLSLRMHGLRFGYTTNSNNEVVGRLPLDILSCAAPILGPRLAFNIMSDNMLFLALRSMMGDFLTLTGLSIWCFGGFWFSLQWLHDGTHQPETIGKWMIWIWFGLDGTGIDQSPDFHWLLGPALMIAFAFLGNTLFLTILVSMLTNTFSSITTNAVSEIQYRRSVLTFMGVKSDAIFAFQPPFNLLACFFLLPLKFVLSPRIFHKLNVVCVKILNMPLLVLISLYERRTLWVPKRYGHFRARKIDWEDPRGPRGIGASWYSRTFAEWGLSKFSAHGDIQAVFDAEPPGSWLKDQPGDESEESSTNRRSAVYRGTPIVSGLSSNFDDVPEHDRVAVWPPANRTHARKSLKRHSLAPRLDLSPETATDSAYAPTLKRWMSRSRRDSITDYDGDQSNNHETNARLIKLEQGMKRIESLLQQLLDDNGEDESETQQQLRIDAQAEGL